ncbi:MAG: cytidine deaminase [Lachnospiraceae bacterium]|jgi:cytidine deaminase|nr:cytidine deaminase [Lachnospiraceae bacterium]
MIEISSEMTAKLIATAHEMQKYSYIPYVEFAVGAALLTADDEIYTGCNIQNAALSPNICAERTAFFKAVSEGKTKFKAIAIVGGPDREIGDFCFPCGVCRQVMVEYCDPDSFIIITANDKGEVKTVTLSELLPYSFGPENL